MLCRNTPRLLTQSVFPKCRVETKWLATRLHDTSYGLDTKPNPVSAAWWRVWQDSANLLCFAGSSPWSERLKRVGSTLHEETIASRKGLENYNVREFLWAMMEAVCVESSERTEGDCCLKLWLVLKTTHEPPPQAKVAIIAPRDEPFGIRYRLAKGSSRGAMMATLTALRLSSNGDDSEHEWVRVSNIRTATRLEPCREISTARCSRQEDAGRGVSFPERSAWRGRAMAGSSRLARLHQSRPARR